MVRIALVIILILSAFIGGYWLAKQDDKALQKLQGEMAQEKGKVFELESRNTELKQTLQLVKRQIQTDRIAYESLQQVVQSSDLEQTQLREALQQQRKLLKELQQRLQQKASSADQ